MKKIELFKRERLYIKAIKANVIEKSLVHIDELGLIQCRYENKRRIKKPTYIKVSIYTIHKHYVNLGIIFRDKHKNYYSIEEVEQQLIKYYKENNIEYGINECA